ncbi:hypothetical protein EHP00_1422 [Ecytonucleospora hepatopenaei]|uniref:Uncharacterized protein n=1 Tax=Ecytonucleospora hepatopenaei TaxID=646526 RepID=A0A1W0E584_9MICR|nr:hypothetical protein EHP00_1422 [Ecytonucleospora hepatopenaei]
MNIFCFFNLLQVCFSIINDFTEIKKVLELRNKRNYGRIHDFYKNDSLRNILTKNYCHCNVNTVFLLRPMKGFRTKYTHFDKKSYVY